MKIKVIIISVLSLVLLASCSSDTTAIVNENSELYAEVESLKAENELLKQQLTETQATTKITSPPQETTTTSKTEPVKKSVWELKYFVDDFNRLTDEFYLLGEFKGTFSNSATTNSSLGVRIIVTRDKLTSEVTDYVKIKLYEYDSNEVKNYYSRSKRYKVQVLEENDNIIKENGYMASDRISVWGDQDQNTILNALKNNEKLTFRIDDEDGMDTYMFDVDCTGFKDLFESTDWNV